MKPEHLIWFVCGICVGVSWRKTAPVLAPQYQPSPVEREIAALLSEEPDMGAWYALGDGMAGIPLGDKPPS